MLCAACGSLHAISVTPPVLKMIQHAFPSVATQRIIFEWSVRSIWSCMCEMCSYLTCLVVKSLRVALVSHAFT